MKTKISLSGGSPHSNRITREVATLVAKVKITLGNTPHFRIWHDGDNRATAVEFRWRRLSGSVAHVIGAGKQRGRDSEAERLSGKCSHAGFSTPPTSHQVRTVSTNSCGAPPEK